MKKNLRRATACILTLLLCLNLCAGAVFAVDDTDETETPAATDTDDTADLESVGTGSVVVEPEAQTSTDSSAQAPTGEGGAPSDASSSKAEAEAQTPGTESGAAAQDDGASQKALHPKRIGRVKAAPTQRGPARKTGLQVVRA